MIRPSILAKLAITTSVLSGCLSPVAEVPDVAGHTDKNICQATQTLPALVETVTEQVMVQPAKTNADGVVVEPAVFQTQSRQAIVRERQEKTYETPCPKDMTPEFIATLQRALKARGYYSGGIDGEMTPATGQAVARYQTTLGLPSPILSMDTARKLGLVAYTREEILGSNS